MPGKLVKHVHFSESPSSAPSPTFSSSTLPSTPGPITPPLGFESPYHYTPLPRDENAVPNPIIAVAKKLLIEYDLSQPPSTAIILLHNIPHKVWEQPATQPFSSSIEMICPRLPWKLTVNSRAHPFVTIGDVLEGLYRLLRTNVTPAEFALLPSAEAQHKVTAAYIYRCKQISDPAQQDAEMKKGMKRIDFLGNHTQYKGIVLGKDGRWTLLVS